MKKISFIFFLALLSLMANAHDTQIEDFNHNLNAENGDELYDTPQNQVIFADSTFGGTENNYAPTTSSGWELWHAGKKRTPGMDYNYNGARIFKNLGLKNLSVGYFCDGQWPNSFIIYGNGSIDGVPLLILPVGMLNFSYYAANWKGNEAHEIHFQILDSNDVIVFDNVSYTSTNKNMGGMRSSNIEADYFNFRWNCPIKGQYKIKIGSPVGETLIGNISIVKQDVVNITEMNFPDANFRNWILTQPYGKDSVLTHEEIADVQVIDVKEKNITSLRGIEFFTALTELYCYGNHIKDFTMDELVVNLPYVRNGKMYVSIESDDYSSAMNIYQVDVAKAKGWTPQYYNGSSWTEYTNDDYYLQFDFNKGEAAVASVVDKYPNNISIPETVPYNGVIYRVTSIEEGAFSGCSRISSITIPSSITSIGDNAFSGCNALTKVEINSNLILQGYNSSFSLKDVYGNQVIEYILGEKVTSIGNYAFSNCSGLTSIEIPNSVTSIGNYAFRDCSGLTEVTIPNSVTSIGELAFFGCSGLTSVTIPNSVTTIGNYAFQKCSSLASVTIPNSVTSIGDYAFSGCTKLKSVTLPEGLTTIGSYAFSNSGLITMTIPSTVNSIGNYALAGNVIYCNLPAPISVGTLMNNASDVVLYVPKGTEDAFSQADGWKQFLIAGGTGDGNEDEDVTDWTEGEITVKLDEAGDLRLAIIELDDEEIKRLKISGPMNSTDLAYLVEGNGKIASLESLDLSDVTLVYDGGCYRSGGSSGISDEGFGSNYSYYYLTEEEHYGSSHTIGIAPTYYFRYYGPNLVGVFNGKPYKHIVLPKSVTKAAYSVCSGNSELESVEFPGGLTKVDDYAFSGCKKIKEIDLTSVDSIGRWAFSGCSILKHLDGLDKVKSIGQGAFEDCKLLGSDGEPLPLIALDTIPNNAFDGCVMLSGIRLSDNLHYIGESAFNGCSLLSSVTLPEGLTGIGKSAFNGCKLLSSVTLPESLTSLSAEAFANCYTLAEVNYPSTLMQVDYTSFDNTLWMDELTGEDGIKYMGHIALCYDKTSGVAEASPAALSFREGTTTIADRFIKSLYISYNQDYTGNVTKINFPASLIRIGDNAFLDNKLSTLTLPAELQEIGESAFANASELTKVTIPVGLKKIGNSVFAKCSKLNVVNYNAVEAVGQGLFKNCTIIEKVTIGAKVTYLPEEIFSGCTALTIVKSEERTDDTPIVIGNMAFYNCTNLTRLTLPANIMSIGDNAFYYCSALTSFATSQSLETIGQNAFYGCSGLSSFQLNEGLKTIGDNAFYYCYNISSFVLPESLDSIGSSAFSDCYMLTEITIPANVTRLGSGFLQSCFNLTKIYSNIITPMTLSSIIPMGANVIQDVYGHYSNWSLYTDIHYDDVTLIVPDGTKTLYQNAGGWKKFRNIEELHGGDVTANNKLYVMGNTVQPGGTTTLEVGLQNVINDFTAFQFDLIVPLGFKLTTDSEGNYNSILGARCDDGSHVLSVSKLPDHPYTDVNKYRFVCVSANNKSIAESFGSLLSATLHAHENYAESEYNATIENAIFTQQDGTQSLLDYVPFAITVKKSEGILLGDANCDGLINVSDAVSVINYILNQPGNNFNRENADVNRDGAITVSDAVEIVNIIMKSGR